MSEAERVAGADERPVAGGRRDRRKRETRRLVESVALELFERQGFRETTVDEIARRTGISARTFFRYYRSKEDVLFGWYSAALDDLVGVALTPGAPACVLRQLQRSVDDFLASDDARTGLEARTFLRFQRVLATDPALRGAEHLYIAPIVERLMGNVARALGPGASELTSRMVLETFGACLRTALEMWNHEGPDAGTLDLIELHHRAAAVLTHLSDPPAR